MSPERRPYKASFNIQMYNVIDRVDLSVRETHPSREVVDLYQESVNYYGGISFVFDNLSHIIWVWVARYVKHRGWAKKIAKTTDPGKLKKIVLKTLEEELDRSFPDNSYEVKRVEEGDHPDDFEMMFLYEVADINLYSEHYLRGDVQMLMPQETEVYVEEKVEKCPKCNWLLSKGKTKCPRCGYDLNDDPEPTQ